MKVLIIGAGGREHALAWKIAQSPKLTKLFIAPGNAGTEEHGENVDLPIDNFKEVGNFVLENNIEMIVVGPEAPLVDGIHDYFLEDPDLQHIMVIGPQKQAAMIEGSKDFAKEFMMKYNIPTASFRTFTKNTIDEGLKYLETIAPPYVLKADGLAAGKGVIISSDLKESQNVLREMISEKKFGDASSSVLIEEFMEGIEVSAFVLTDGTSYKILPNAKDYKRIGEGDTGLNTGGMGSISPVPFVTDEFMNKIEERIIKPTIEGLKKEGMKYKGFIFFGLINRGNDPYVIEYNVRMGDPEAESVIPRIKTDLLDLFIHTGEETLSKTEIELDPRYSTAIMLVSGGYPGKYDKGKLITGLENVYDCILFMAGANKNQEEKIITSGGRVLAISSFGETLQEALNKSYVNAEKVNFDKKYYRTDLGQDLIKYL